MLACTHNLIIFNSEQYLKICLSFSILMKPIASMTKSDLIDFALTLKHVISSCIKYMGLTRPTSDPCKYGSYGLRLFFLLNPFSSGGRSRRQHTGSAKHSRFVLHLVFVL